MKNLKHDEIKNCTFEIKNFWLILNSFEFKLYLLMHSEVHNYWSVCVLKKVLEKAVLKLNYRN